MNKLFDLNIESVLEHWGLEHALREIIANAIDEQILTNSKDIEIYEDSSGGWHIRDYGRGIQYVHFTQNENLEKIQSKNLIGKFGVGLKDALAVFYRHNITVLINSRHASISLTMNKKSGFNIETMHAEFNASVDEKMIGTDFVIQGVTSEDINKAKKMFLKFSDDSILEETRYGNVYETSEGVGFIYVNGVQVAIEDNFMFTYNITNINTKIKKALNRERSNVGRTAYADTIKKILIECESERVMLMLIKDLDNVMTGTNKDESSWIDVSVHAARTINNSGSSVFLTPFERNQLTNQQIEILKQSGKKLIFVTDAVKEKLGKEVTTFYNVMEEYNDSFEYEFVPINRLTKKEREVLKLKDVVIDFLNKYGYRTNAEIFISEKIRINEFGDLTQGVCDGERIIIRRTILENQIEYLGVLLHEFAHFHSGYTDNTREFEAVLTDMLGSIMNEALRSDNSKRTNIFKVFGK